MGQKYGTLHVFYTMRTMFTTFSYVTSVNYEVIQQMLVMITLAIMVWYFVKENDSMNFVDNDDE